MMEAAEANTDMPTTDGMKRKRDKIGAGRLQRAALAWISRHGLAVADLVTCDESYVISCPLSGSFSQE